MSQKVLAYADSMHKDSVFVCILNEKGDKYEAKYGVLTPELEELHRLLLNHGVTEVTMESTGIYWHPVWRILKDIEDLKPVNPYFIKQLPGRKSDVRDAAWIAECTMKDLIRGSFVPEPLVQRMRLYNRRIFDLNKEKICNTQDCFYSKFSYIQAVVRRKSAMKVKYRGTLAFS